MVLYEVQAGERGSPIRFLPYEWNIFSNDDYRCNKEAFTFAVNNLLLSELFLGNRLPWGIVASRAQKPGWSFWNTNLIMSLPYLKPFCILLLYTEILFNIFTLSSTLFWNWGYKISHWGQGQRALSLASQAPQDPWSSRKQGSRIMNHDRMKHGAFNISHRVLCGLRLVYYSSPYLATHRFALVLQPR